jgi:hypothetical protein
MNYWNLWFYGKCVYMDYASELAEIMHLIYNIYFGNLPEATRSIEN